MYILNLEDNILYGKSTTQNILTGLLKLQKGNVVVNGVDISKEDKSRFNKIGVSFEQSNLYSKLTAEENLKYYANFLIYLQEIQKNL